MQRTYKVMQVNLIWRGLWSRLTGLVAAFVMISGVAIAHEVRPAVGDVTVAESTVRIDLTVTLEALVAGIDLADLSDTNDSPLSGYYDRLRALEPTELAERFNKSWPRIADGILLESDGQRLSPTVMSLRIPRVGDIELPRDSVLVITAELPPGDAPVLAGWAPSFGPLVLRQMGAGDDLYSGYLTGNDISAPLPRKGVAQVSALTEFGRYVVLGFEHILPKGLDHILFVLGLFLFSLQLRPLLMQVTAFTLAHTVTLALASLKIVTIPAEIVEPLIAASIVFIAVENILGGRIGWRRVAVVFVFGLLHGLGFASVLGEIGLNPSRFIADLIGFNIGVEVGQLAVISIAYLAVGVWFGGRPWYRRRVVIPASGVIAMIGLWWVIERTLL